MSAHPARPPRVDSIPSSFVTAMPRAIPIMPRTTELRTWPSPHKKVMTVVFVSDHFLALAITMKGM